jgi:hypothetical protein
VAFHLRAEHQFNLQLGDAGFDFEVVVGDQRLDAVQLGGLAHLARELAAVGADAHNLKAEFLRRHAGRGHRVRGVTEDEHALAGEVGGIHRSARTTGTRAAAFGQHRRRVGPASAATSMTKSRVAPMPMGTLLIAFWP